MPMIRRRLRRSLRVPPGQTVRLTEYKTGWAVNDTLKDAGKDAVKAKAKELLEQRLEPLTAAQELLYATGERAVLIVLQAMDAAGKDGTIKHVMSGINPQGCRVTSFKKPSDEERLHTFLWRCSKALPARGMIGIFNRSYYEDVLVTMVHPNLIGFEDDPGKKFWRRRYKDINAFEKHLVRNGTVILKFFLHVSKAEQKQRLIDRLDDSEKHWKFSTSDLAERAYWDDYQHAYEECISATSTRWAPWYVVPADQKWATRAIVAGIVCDTITGLKLKQPEVSAEHRQALADARRQLLAEG